MKVTYEILHSQCRLAAPQIITPKDTKCQIMQKSAMLSCLDCSHRGKKK